MTASIKEGLRAAARNPKLIFLLWGWYALLALVPVFPAWSWWNAVLGYSPEAASVLKGFSLGVFLDLTRRAWSGGLGLLAAAAAAQGVIALVSSVFVFGGVLEVLASEGDRRSFMHRFFRGGGHFFWRFVRLALLAVICAVLATGAVSALVTVLTAPMRESEWEPAAYLASLANLLVLAVVAGLFLLALDYARIRVSRDDSKGMFKAYFRGLGFVLRRFLAAYGIAIAVLAAFAALAIAYLAYETYAPAAANWGAIAVLVLVQQAVVLGRVFLRVSLVGAERHFHMSALPAFVPAADEAAAPVQPVASIPQVPEQQ